MNEELSQRERWFGSVINIVENNNHFYGCVYENGTCFKDNIKSLTYDGCLRKCKVWVEEELEK